MKRKIIILNIITYALLIICITIYNLKSQTFQNDGITYALTVDGENQNSFPSKGMYKVNAECTNAKCKWDYDNWKLYVEDVNGEVSCDILFTTISKTYLNSKIIGLVNSTQGNGSVVNENGYRYEGKNPNNYVWFNNEIWRIIGVFDSSTHAVANTNLVKIIRDKSIGTIAWDKSNKNTWKTSSLKSLLNDYYLYKENGSDSGNCYVYQEKLTKTCDYNAIGINENSRSMIKEVTWYKGQLTKFDSGNSMYTLERRGSTDTGYIGLMYPSDFVYAAPEGTCTRATGTYVNKDCLKNNWLFSGSNEWTISAKYDQSASVFYMGLNQKYESSYNGKYEYRPVLYLDSSVYVIDGDGSVNNPYIIGM